MGWIETRHVPQNSGKNLRVVASFTCAKGLQARCEILAATEIRLQNSGQGFCGLEKGSGFGFHGGSLLLLFAHQLIKSRI